METIKKKYWLLIISMALLGINITYSTDAQLGRINSNVYTSILLMLWGILLYYGLIKKYIELVSNYDWLIGLIFSLLYCVTFIVNNGQVKEYISGGLNTFFTAFSILCWTIVYTLTFNFLRRWFGTKLSLRTNLPKTIYIWLFLAIIWFISIAGFLPGQISWDGLRQLCEFDGTHITVLKFSYVPTNHHPWFTTIIFGTLFNIGKSFFGTNGGVFAVVAFQFVISSIIYTFVVKYVWQKIGKIGGVLSFIMFASPIFSSYAITVDKSTLYYAFSAWFYLSFAEIFETIISSKKISINYILSYGASSILVGFFRNDAFLIVVIATVILLCLLIKHLHKLLLIFTMFVVVLGVHFGWNIYLSNKKVIKSSPSEALTIPIRQLSYVYIKENTNLSNSDLKNINKITPLSKIKQNYDVNNGDYLKALSPSDTFLNSEFIIREVVHGKKSLKTTRQEKNDFKKYLSTWLHVGIQHPIDYINVYIAANSRYLNPFILYEENLFLNYYPNMPYFMKPSWYDQYHPIFNNKVRDSWQKILIMISMAPPLAVTGNPATIVWLSLLLFFILISLKEFKEVLFLLPLLIMCLMFTVTSINGYTRYTIGALAVFPIVISYLWSYTYNQKVLIKGKNND